MCWYVCAKRKGLYMICIESWEDVCVVDDDDDRGGI